MRFRFSVCRLNSCRYSVLCMPVSLVAMYRFRYLVLCDAENKKICHVSASYFQSLVLFSLIVGVLRRAEMRSRPPLDGVCSGCLHFGCFGNWLRLRGEKSKTERRKNVTHLSTLPIVINVGME